MANQLQHVLGHIRQLIERERGDDQGDGLLLDRFLARNEEDAFVTLVERYGPMVLGVCRRVLLNSADADDAFQVTFLTLACKARHLRRRQAIGSWLYRVAYCVSLRAKVSAARRRAREGRAEMRVQPPDQVVAAEWRDLGPLLDDELARLPEKLRAPLVLCCLEGKTNEEAAHALGWPIGSISKRLARGREILRERLSRRGLGLSVTLLGTLLEDGAQAAVPASLHEITVHSTRLLAKGQAAAFGSLPLGIAQLLRETLWGLLVTRLRTAVLGIMLAIGLLAGLGVAAHALTGRPSLTTPEMFAAAEPGPDAEAAAPAPAGPPRLGNASDPLPNGAVGRMGSTRLLLGGPTNVAVASPDGGMLALAGRDSEIRICETTSGKELRRLTTPGSVPAAIALSPDRQTVAVGSFQRLRLWGPDGELAAFRTNATSAYGLAFSPDGRVLAAADGEDMFIRLWDVATGKELHRLSGHRGWVNLVAFAPDGRMLATGGGERLAKDFAVRLWDSTSGKLLQELTGHEAPITALTFSPDKRLLASSCGDGKLRLWEAATGKELRQTQELGRGVRCLTFAPDGATLATTDRTGVCLWKTATLQMKERFRWEMADEPDEALAVMFLDGGATLAATSEVGQVRLWNLTSGSSRQLFQRQPGAVVALALSPDARSLISADGAPAVRLWDLSTGQEVRHFKMPAHEIPTCLAVSPDGRLVIAGTDLGLIYRWDLATGQESRTFVVEEKSIVSVGFTADSKTVAALIRGDVRTSTLDALTLHLWD